MVGRSGTSNQLIDRGLLPDLSRFGDCILGNVVAALRSRGLFQLQFPLADLIRVTDTTPSQPGFSGTQAVP